MIQTYQVSRRDATPVHTERLLGSIANVDSPESVLERLKSMKRSDLIHLFKVSRTPTDLAELEGEWNGCLLNNNGLIMTTVSSIMTNGLFGKFRKWNGKWLQDSGRGINRFLTTDGIATEHSFDYGLSESRLVQKQKVVKLTYTKHHHPFSLWHTMVDEVRFIPGDIEILIGFGSMAWSGGYLNAAPFCLWRSQNDPSNYNVQQTSETYTNPADL